MLRRLIGEDVHLVWRPACNLWPVRIDPSQIDQLLANLCVNARDAIAGVGTVAIETGNGSLDEAYCADHEGSAPGEYVLLAVSDNGCGMSKETQGKLFEPFFLPPRNRGRGRVSVWPRSTALSSRTTDINVYSEPDQGATFKIYLPRHIGEAAPAHVERVPDPRCAVRRRSCSRKTNRPCLN